MCFRPWGLVVVRGMLGCNGLGFRGVPNCSVSLPPEHVEAWPFITYGLLPLG